jgi:dTDP-4-amino-4,6-dideoxygalactose transaminase
LRALAQAGISARGGILNAHQQPPYAEMCAQLPMSEATSRSALMLPLYPGMTDAEQDRVVEVLSHQ